MSFDFQRMRRHPIVVPFLWAFLFHGVLLAASFWIRFAGLTEDVPHEENLRFNVQSVSPGPVKIAGRGGASAPKRFLANERRKSVSRMPSSMPKDVPVDELVRTIESPAEIEKKEVPPPHQQPTKGVTSGVDFEKELNRAGQMETSEVVQIQPKSSAGAPEIERMAERGGAATASALSRLAETLQGLQIAAGGNVRIDPEEGMPGFTPVAGDFGSDDVDQGTGEAKGDITPYEALDEFLDIDVQTYEDPKDKEKYFLISIFVKKDGKGFRVMPKEIIFEIDSSLSIERERLEEIKRGIGASLKKLNPEDVFNIVAFKDKPAFFAKQSVQATPQAIADAEKFVLSLTPSQRTDVYGAVKGIVETKPSRVPSDIVLISDGKPTHGIVNARELLSAITKINNKVRPIFVFSGGSRVNRYLMDFIAYQNRAWSQYIKRTSDIDKGLLAFYDKIKDPIFLNLRYRLNGLDENEVFPRELPDFYRNAKFTLYGRYTGENEFSMQLLGDVDGQTKELVFSRGLTKAKKGGADIRTGWAFNKVYALISEYTETGNAALLKEADALGKKYGVKTPYSPELERMD